MVEALHLCKYIDYKEHHGLSDLPDLSYFFNLKQLYLRTSGLR